MIPVAVVRIDNNHRTVGGASAQRCAARIKHAVPRSSKFLVKLLLSIVGVVAHEEVPGEALVFRSARMKRGDLIVEAFLVTTSLEQQHPEARKRQISGQEATAGSRAHDDIVECVAIARRRTIERRSDLRRVSRPEDRNAPADERAYGRDAGTARLDETAPGHGAGERGTRITALRQNLKATGCPLSYQNERE